MRRSFVLTKLDIQRPEFFSTLDHVICVNKFAVIYTKNA